MAKHPKRSPRPLPPPPEIPDPPAEMAKLFPQLSPEAQIAYVILVRRELAGSLTLKQLLATFNKGYR